MSVIRLEDRRVPALHLFTNLGEVYYAAYDLEHLREMIQGDDKTPLAGTWTELKDTEEVALAARGTGEEVVKTARDWAQHGPGLVAGLDDD